MGVYSKTLHHVNNKDFKKTHQRHLDEQKFLSLKIREQEILEQKEVEQIKDISLPFKSDWKSELFPEIKQEVKKEEVKVNVKVPEHLKYNWRKELAEGMTTGGQEIQFAPSDVPLDTIDAADPASFTANNGGFDSDPPSDGLSGAEIVSSGTGSGNNGGFNLGRSYLSFNGVGFNDGATPQFDNVRHVILTPVDATRATTLEVTAIVGNGSNGGEAPGVNQDITLWYTDANNPDTITAALDDNYNLITVVPYNGSGSLRTYSVTIPNNEINQLRRSGISFILHQEQGNNPTTTGDNYGITEIKVKRTTPISVMAPLDTPEAVSFFRVGPTPNSPNYETPEQRYRRVMQQLLASKNYTNQKFGSNYPGSNFSGIRGVSASPLGRDGMLSAWGGGIVPDGAWGDYFPSGTFGRADIGSGMAQRSTLSPNKGIGSGMSGSATPAPGTDDYYYKLGGGDYSLQGFQKAGQNKTRQDIIDRGKKLLASNQKYIDSQKQKTTVSKPASKSSGPLGAVKAASLAAAASKAATPKPVSKPISLKGTDLQGRPLKAGPQTPTPPGYKGTFKPGPLTGKDIPKTSTQALKPSSSSGYKGYGSLPQTSKPSVQAPKPSLGFKINEPLNPPKTRIVGPASPSKSAAPAPKPSLNLTSKQQANIKSVQQQLKPLALAGKLATSVAKKDVAGTIATGAAIAKELSQVKPSSSNLGGPKGTGSSTIKGATTKSQTVGSYKPPAPAPKPTTTVRKK